MSDKIKISKSNSVNWKNNSIQFARFIAEAEAVGAFEDTTVIRDLSDSMDLTVDETCEIIDRAQKVWDDIKLKMLASKKSR